MSHVLFGSLTLITDFTARPLAFAPLPRAEWAAGDYVVAEVLPHATPTLGFELPDGRLAAPLPGALLVGAFGKRAATLEAVGSFEDIEDDGLMHGMTGGGCFGRVTSISRFTEDLLPLQYRGHVMVDGGKVGMLDFVPPAPDATFSTPVVMVVGTSMSAGKTFSARVAVNELKALGLKVAGAKLTGAGRRRDVLSLRDAGADYIFDFIDAGLPTTVCPAEEYREAIGGLLARIATTDADVVVVEAGASPLEPYNGGSAVEMLGEHIVFTILCASDPYAVVGTQSAWQRDFDIVAGPTANTDAGVELVRRLSSLPAVDLLDPGSHPDLRKRLANALGLGGEV